ncbi:extracellular solute-binding protein [Curtobacterium flaccumfaciens]|uniref:ABC transporter substrate-binding protein n=1 Tax=Curtobacterium flaccumfaciens TaxID=2035 RepID=UPI00188C57C8|nr:extracellular solute-binding protein [Curtobacterium flaccumfaciens]MBF4595641.1 extracellular solute-binding protein [Curtobacterium flaccumfaciens]
MKFSRWTGLFAGAAVIALAAAGCASNSSSAGPQTSADEKQTINVWGWAGAPGKDVMTTVIDGFEKANPKITVNYTEIASADYKNKATLALSSKEPIDVVGVQPNAWASDNAQYLTPVGEWPNGKALEQQYQPRTITQMKKLFPDGGIRAVPFGSSGSAVGFYNVDLLRKAGLSEPPKTLADFRKLADGLKGTGIVPAVMPSDDWFQDEFVLTLAGQTDPKFYDDVRYKDGSYDTKAYISALKEYKSLYTDGILDKNTLDLAYSDAMALFDSGKAAVVFNGSWEAGRLLPEYRKANKVQASDVGAMGVPAAKAADVSTRSFLDVTYGIPEASSHRAAAEKFIEYATVGAGVDDWATKLSFIPAAKDWSLPSGTLKTEVEKQGYKDLQQLIANPSSDRNNLSNLSAQIGTYVLQVASGTMTPEEAAKQAQADHESGKYN